MKLGQVFQTVCLSVYLCVGMGWEGRGGGQGSVTKQIENLTQTQATA